MNTSELHNGVVRRVTAAGYHVELPRVARGHTLGPVETTADAPLAVDDRVLVGFLEPGPRPVIVGRLTPAPVAHVDADHAGTFAAIEHDSAHDDRFSQLAHLHAHDDLTDRENTDAHRQYLWTPHGGVLTNPNFDYGDDRNFYGWSATCTGVTGDGQWTTADGGRSHSGPAAIKYAQTTGTPGGSCVMYLGGPRRLWGRGVTAADTGDIVGSWLNYPTVRPGQTVAFKYRASRGGSGWTQGPRPLMFFHDKDGNSLGSVVGSYAIPPGTNLWDQTSERVLAGIAPAGAQYVRLGVQIHTSEAMTGSYYFDSFEVRIGTFGYCRLYLGTTFSVSHNTTTTVNWDSEEDDLLGMHEGVTNPSRITIPADTGAVVVKVNAEIGFGGNSAGAQRILMLRRNNQEHKRITIPPMSAASGLAASDELVANGGDYFEVLAFQDSTATLSLRTGALGSGAGSRFSLSYRPYP